MDIRWLLSTKLEKLKLPTFVLCTVCIVTASFGPLVTARLFAAGSVTVSESGTTVQLGNDYLERTIAFDGGVVRTTSFRNKLSGSLLVVTGDEFELRLISDDMFRHEDKEPVILTSRDFRLVSHRVEDEEDGGKRVIFHLACAGLDATLIYELKPHDCFTRKWIKLENKGPGTPFIDWIAVEKNRWYKESFSRGGFGQPLLTKDMFFGLEYPSSINTARHSLVTLAYYVGVDIPPKGFTTQPAVVGVASPGSAHIAFMKYINEIRMSRPRPFIVFESWDDLPGSMLASAPMIKRIGEIKEDFVNKYGVRLDSVILDDQWDNLSKLWAIDKARFPSGFQEVEGAAKEIAAGLGIWFGPIGGYGKRREARIAEGIREGMEVNSTGDFFCLAGRNYSRYFRDTTLKMENTYHINYFKMDGINFTCNEPGHGHPLGIYSREAAMRQWIKTLEALHAANPRAFLGNATGPWLSPWWLLYCDDVDYHGRDLGFSNTVPSLSPRQAAMNYSDALVYKDFRVLHLQFPISSLDAVGIHKGRFNFSQFEHESLDDWKDAVVNCVTTGIMKIDLYISPELLGPKEWQVLGQTLRWTRQNAHPLVDNSTMILGDPAKRQPYGYLHFSPTKTIVALRNPFIRPRTISLKLDRKAGFEHTNRTFQAVVEFPYRMVLPGSFRYGDTLKVGLDGYEQCVVELRSEEGTAAVVGTRYSTVVSNDDEMEFRLYGARETAEVVDLPHVGSYRKILLAGAPVKVQTEGSQGRLTVHFGNGPARESQPSFSVPSIVVKSEEVAAKKLRVYLTVQVPADFQKAEMVLLLDPATQLPGVKARLLRNGKPSALDLYTGGKGTFYSFGANLRTGNNKVQFNVTLPAKAASTPINISGWLRAKRALAGKDLILVYGKGRTAKTAATIESSLPAISRIERTTYPIFKQTLP